MSARFRARRHLVNQVVARAANWAAAQPDVHACVVVGSYAYGRPRMGSDVDLVILSEASRRHLDDLCFISEITPQGRLVRSAQWGSLRERRVRLPGGLFVEFGIATPGWATIPVDPGTAKVITDGCRILTDTGLIADALISLGHAPRRWRPVT